MKSIQEQLKSYPHYSAISPLELDDVESQNSTSLRHSKPYDPMPQIEHIPDDRSTAERLSSNIGRTMASASRAVILGTAAGTATYLTGINLVPGLKMSEQGEVMAHGGDIPSDADFENILNSEGLNSENNAGINHTSAAIGIGVGVLTAIGKFVKDMRQ